MDVEELKQATLYRNCDMATQKCQWFFEVLAGWQQGEPMCDNEEVRESLTEPFGTQNKKVLKGLSNYQHGDQIGCRVTNTVTR